jgi:hypothetical protein
VLQERLDAAALAYKAERAKMAEEEIIAMEVRRFLVPGGAQCVGTEGGEKRAGMVCVMAHSVG